MNDPDALRCDACGCSWEYRLVSMTVSNTECTILCELCEGLIKAGMLRRDNNDKDGTPRYRQWNFEWTPGKLLPKPEAPHITRRGKTK
jgi:hypothetical protein